MNNNNIWQQILTKYKNTDDYKKIRFVYKNYKVTFDCAKLFKEKLYKSEDEFNELNKKYKDLEQQIQSFEYLVALKNDLFIKETILNKEKELFETYKKHFIETLSFRK